jgi:putative hemolysin
MYKQLSAFLVSPEMRTVPLARYELRAIATNSECEVRIPKLIKTYIAVGARICSPPAWDREFGTIDFLTPARPRAAYSGRQEPFLPQR